MIYKILETALPVFITLALGILCRSKKIISREGIEYAKKIALNIGLPAVMLSTFSAADYSAETLPVPLTAFIITAAGLALGYVAKAVLKEKHCFPFMMTGFETGMLGYGLFALLFKGQSNSMLALLDFGTAAFVLTIYKMLICGRNGVKSALKSAVESPVLWGIITGVIIGVSGLYDAMDPDGIRSVFLTVTEFIGAPTNVLILLGIGYDLDFSDVHWGRVMRTASARIVVTGIMFLAYVFVNNAFLKNIIPMGTLVLYIILPPPYIVPIFADDEDERADISAGLSLSTLLCLLGFTIMAAVV